MYNFTAAILKGFARAVRYCEQNELDEGRGDPNRRVNSAQCFCYLSAVSNRHNEIPTHRKTELKYSPRIEYPEPISLGSIVIHVPIITRFCALAPH